MRRSMAGGVALILCAFLVAGAVFWFSYRAVNPSTPTASPTTAALPSQVPLPVPSEIPSEQPSSSSPTASVTTKPQPPSIKASEPTLLYIPTLKKYVAMDNKSCPQDPDGLFDPDRSKMMAACYVHNSKYVYVLPGTSTADVSVIYGHTWRQGQAAFNVLFDWKRQQFRIKPGDELWVRTKTSGKRWLVYKASEFFKPAKYGDKSLRTDTKIWGTAPMPNTLITAGCLQPQDLDLHSSRNIVIKWTFVGVRK